MELLLNTKFKIIHLWCTMNFSLNAVVFQTQLKAPLHSSAKLKKEVQNTHFFLSLLFFLIRFFKLYCNKIWIFILPSEGDMLSFR